MWPAEEPSVARRESMPSGTGMDNTYCCRSLRKLIDEIQKNLTGQGFDV
jgi:hypothetical protein